MGADLDRAADAVRDGEMVVYPTETVYGLGADALDPTAVKRVFATKNRPLNRPISLAVPSIADSLQFIRADDRTRAFMDAFLPGPVTVVAPKRSVVPDVLTAEGDRVGIRVPDHPVARSLLDRVAPLTATSANLTGRSSVRTPDNLDGALREAVAVVLDGGRSPGGGSTVVDLEQAVIHRRGHQADAVEAWLAEQ